VVTIITLRILGLHSGLFYLFASLENVLLNVGEQGENGGLPAKVPRDEPHAFINHFIKHLFELLQLFYELPERLVVRFLVDELGEDFPVGDFFIEHNWGTDHAEVGSFVILNVIA